MSERVRLFLRVLTATLVACLLAMAFLLDASVQETPAQRAVWVVLSVALSVGAAFAAIRARGN